MAVSNTGNRKKAVKSTSEKVKAKKTVSHQISGRKFTVQAVFKEEAENGIAAALLRLMTHDVKQQHHRQA